MTEPDTEFLWVTPDEVEQRLRRNDLLRLVRLGPQPQRPAYIGVDMNGMLLAFMVLMAVPVVLAAALLIVLLLLRAFGAKGLQ